jgi:hypothetical protein
MPMIEFTSYAIMIDPKLQLVSAIAPKVELPQNLWTIEPAYFVQPILDAAGLSELWVHDVDLNFQIEPREMKIFEFGRELLCTDQYDRDEVVGEPGFIINGVCVYGTAVIVSVNDSVAHYTSIVPGNVDATRDEVESMITWVNREAVDK